MIGLVAAVVGSQLFADDDSPATGDGSRIATGEISSPEDLLPDDVPIPAGAGAASPEEAVTGFLDAEMATDFETSFGHLSDAERAGYGSPAGWVSAHADVVPPVVEYEIIEQSAVEAGRETVVAQVTFEPGLDKVVGLTPGEAIVRWDVVEGADGWGVSVETSVLDPQYPSDDGVVPAAREWVDARRQCRAPDNEHGGLVGSPALADTLCDAGAVDVGEPQALDDVAGQPVFTAFGPEAVTAARFVRVDGAVDLGLVLVPIGSQWTVIGVLP